MPSAIRMHACRYDSHRDQILRAGSHQAGGGSGGASPEQAHAPEDTFLYQYFSSSCYSGFSDGPKVRLSPAAAAPLNACCLLTPVPLPHEPLLNHPFQRPHAPLPCYWCAHSYEVIYTQACGCSSKGNASLCMQGFYTVFAEVFAKLARAEAEAAERAAARGGKGGGEGGAPLPGLGGLQAPWAAVSAFYQAWLHFVSDREFAWADAHNLASAPNRKVRCNTPLYTAR